MEAPWSPFLGMEYRLRSLTSLNLSLHKIFNQCRLQFCLCPILQSWRRSFRQGNIWADFKLSTCTKNTVPRFLYALECFRLQVMEYTTTSSLNNEHLSYNNKRNPKVKCFPGVIHQFMILPRTQVLPIFLFCHPQLKIFPHRQKMGAQVPGLTCRHNQIQWMFFLY